MIPSDRDANETRDTASESEQPEQAPSGSVVHGGEGDPLGGGVADLAPSPDVSEGIPDQGTESPGDAPSAQT